MENEIVLMDRNLKELKAKADQASDEHAKLKQEKTDLSDRLNNTRQLLANCRSDCVRLRSRIVHNPEQIQQAIRDMHASLSSLKTECDSFEHASRNLQTKLESLALVEQDIISCMDVLKECETEHAHLDQMMQGLTKAKDEVYRKQSEIREVEIKEQQLQRQHVSTADKLSRLRAQVDSKRSSMDQRLEALRMEWNKSGKERSDLQDQLDKYEQVINETRQKIHKMKVQHDGEVSSIQADFHKLKQQVMCYIGDLRKGMVMGECN